MSRDDLCSYAFFIAAVATSDLRRNAYYFLAAVLGVHDCGFLLMTIFYSVPSMIAQRNIGGDNARKTLRTSIPRR